MTNTGDSKRGQGASSQAFSPGELIAERFLVGRLLGAGGLGEVYEVMDQALGGAVALKVLKPTVSTNPVLLERFRREIQNARRITHPNVCRVFDLGIHRSGAQQRFFVTMEVLGGESLASYLAGRPALTTAEALPGLAQLAAGLLAAHDSGVIHRDLKPANVMHLPAETASRQVVITDFGLAISVDQLDLGLTDTWELIGTPEYMAPEQTKRGTRDARDGRVRARAHRVRDAHEAQPVRSGGHADRYRRQAPLRTAARALRQGSSVTSSLRLGGRDRAQPRDGPAPPLPAPGRAHRGAQREEQRSPVAQAQPALTPRIAAAHTRAVQGGSPQLGRADDSRHSRRSPEEG